MARSPFAPPLPATPTTPASPASPLRPNVGGNAPAPREEGARRTLVVGRGISVQGTVQDAERLVVEGTVEATMINGLAELSIAHGGMLKGEVEVEEAEVAGTIDGTLVARQSLIVRATGRLLGTARCRRLQVEDGGQITGRIEMMTDAASPASYTPAPSAKIED
ncbi:bactofilin family protein [Acidocella sp.]|uniref:bactofilin family protein n=1 Tax=Acidocella sp. TaxID=50710 RepID=UPI002F3FEABE